jgi:hypothetical protein
MLEMPIPEEYQHRLPLEALACMTPQAAAKLGVRPLHEAARDIANRQLAHARKALSDLSPALRRQRMRQAWAALLGDIEPQPAPAVRHFGLASGKTAWPEAMTFCSAVVETAQPAHFRPEKVLLTVAPRIDVPVLMLWPGGAGQAPGFDPGNAALPASGIARPSSASQPGNSANRSSPSVARVPGPAAPATRHSGPGTQDAAVPRRPVVICIAQQGKAAFLSRRAGEIAQLLSQGIAVCLTDLRGMGETAPGDARDHTAEITLISAENLKLGQPLLGSKLRDLRSVIRYLATRDDIDASRLAVWGDSFSPTNPAEFVDPPLRSAISPTHAEPAGAILAMLAGLFEDNIKAVLGRGCLTSYAAILDAPAFYVPHDAIVPGALEVADLPDLAAALAPMPLRLESLVDGRNRAAGDEAVIAAFAAARPSYAASPDALQLSAATQFNAGTWLGRMLLGE